MANLRTKILGFRVSDSSRILILRVGVPMSIGKLPVLSQQILAGTILVGRSGVRSVSQGRALRSARRGPAGVGPVSSTGLEENTLGVAFPLLSSRSLLISYWEGEEAVLLAIFADQNTTLSKMTIAAVTVLFAMTLLSKMAIKTTVALLSSHLLFISYWE